jgi:hypothetical protein
LRDFILCAVIVTIVSSGTTVAQRYIANLQRQPSSRQTVAVQSAQLNTGPEPEAMASLSLDESEWTPGTGQMGLQPGREPRPVLGSEQTIATRKADAQPPLAAPALSSTPDPPAKRMVGPDGVTFTRSSNVRFQTAAFGREARPIAPERPGPAEQAKASDPQAVVATEDRAEGKKDRPSAPAGRRQEPTIAAASKSEDRQAAPTPTKAGVLMVGPDGVIYRPAEEPRAIAPR